MAAVKRCCVPNCGVNNEILHKFPNPDKEPERFRTWIYKVGGDILAKENRYIYKYRRVCHLHFEEKFHTRSKALSPNSVPTLRLSGFSSRVRPPLVDINNQISDFSSAVPMMSGSCSVGRQSTVDPHIPNQNSVIMSSVTSTSGSCSVERQFTVDQHKPNRNQTSVVMPIVASTSGTIKKKPVPRKQSLLKVIKVLQKRNQSYKETLKSARKLSTNKAFQNALKKFKTLAAIFTIMQFREILKPKMGRRFTKEEKIMSLSLYKLGPRAYRWLSKIFVLPSPVTVSRLVSRAGLKPGMNENIFSHLKKKALTMKTEQKLCTLLFDEMALAPHFDYNRKKDKIIGFVNYEGESIRKIADHVLVFMIRGITKNYKQPIYYSFSSGSTPKEILSRLIKNIIKKLHSTGFTVLATICDQGTSNTSAINLLINETRHEYFRSNNTLKYSVFEIDGKRIIPLYDVPHLLKGIRNNLLTKNLKYTIDGQEKMAKWEHIIKLYDNSPSYRGLKVIKNFTENHCIKEKIPKMKVKYASQLFSQTVARTMGYLTETGVLPPETTDTADFILFIDDLFDSMNGSFINAKNRTGKDLLRNVTPNSRHKEVWNMSKKVLKSMKFVNIRGSGGTVPSINNWIHTLENIELLVDTLFNDHNIKSIWCRHLNQDPLENFFGSIRSHGIRNISPTCAAFEAAFASLLINNLSSNYAVGSNCEEDFCSNLDSFDELFFPKSLSTINETSEIELTDFLNTDIIIDYEQKITNPTVKAQIEYVTGYLLRKCKSIIKNCKNCHFDMFENDSNKNRYLVYREYNKNKRYLTYPKDNIKKYFSAIQDVAYYVIKNKSNHNNLQAYIKLLIEVSVETHFLNCNTHKRDFIEFINNFCSRFFIYNWCKSTNKLMIGANRYKDDGDTIQKDAVLLCNKRRRK